MNKRFDHRLGLLEKYAETHTIRTSDFFDIIDCFLTCCAKYVDERTMEQIEQETDRVFIANIGQTRDEWSWREFRAIKEMSDEDLMNVIQKHLS